MMRTGKATTMIGVGRGLSVFTAALMLSACSQTADLLGPTALAPEANPTQLAEAEPQAQTDLQKATKYWGEEYQKDQKSLTNALSYARNLKALGEKQKAINVLQNASVFHGANKELASEYGRLALEVDHLSVAEKLLTMADDPTNPDWKTISARGTVLAKKGQYKDAIPMFEKALTLSNNQPSVLNNLAMAHVMNGEPQKAEELLRKVVANGSVPPKVSQNLALVLGLQGRYDEANTYAVTSAGAETLKSDTATIRQMVKLSPKLNPAAITTPPTSVATAKPSNANDAFRPALVENTTAPAWQTKTASATAPIPAAKAAPVAVQPAAPPSAPPGLGFKGTSR